MRCRWVADFGRRRLNLDDPAEIRGRTAAFLVLHARWSRDTSDELVRRAILTATVYRTHCWLRQTRASAEVTREALSQHMQEVVRGHVAATGAVRRAFG